MIAALTLLIANDIIAIFVRLKYYRIVVTSLLNIFGVFELTCFIGLYSKFIP